MTTPNTFVAEVNLKLASKMQEDLKSQGFEITQVPYSIFSAKKKGISCTLYTSGKLVVQGREKDSFIEFYLEPEILGSCCYTHKEIFLDKTAHIGVDESGKGDFFGPLCIAAVFAEGASIAELSKMGVCDSKRLNDVTIGSLAAKIRDHYPHHLIQLNPLKYNDLYRQFRNLNQLLGWGHATVIEQLVQKTGCTNVLIDQFAGEHVVENALQKKGVTVSLKQRHRGEEDVVVAAASILARDLFVRGIENLGKTYGMRLPKGASPDVISAAKAFVAMHGIDALPNVCKMHFKTLDAITGSSL